MWIFNSIFGKIFEIIFIPFRSLSPWVGMTLISLLTGLLMLLIFRYTSNQEGIRKVKNKIKAHLLELRLFKDSLALSLKAQGNIFRSNIKYIGYSGKPLLVMIVPLILILIQLNFWFAYQSLQPGEITILKVKVQEGQNILDLELKIEPPRSLAIETLPLRIEEQQEINWRLRAKEGGLHSLVFRINGQSFVKKVSVAQKPLSRISPLRVRRNFIDELFNPGEAPISKDIPVKSIEVKYPNKNMNLFGWHIHWIIVYFALSIIFGFALKGVLKVEI
ncbi:MAG: hypothetical protein GTO17_12660 [Candidatus Aminicenantes bacterium]|nr:hypothetical protein [Candidatus Aminicenantes bacterium]